MMTDLLLTVIEFVQNQWETLRRKRQSKKLKRSAN